MKKIYVKGSIIYCSPRFRYHSESGALFDESYAEKADEIVEGDLIIGPSSKDQGSIYNIYWAQKGFIATTFWDEYIPLTISNIKKQFYQEIDSTKDLLPEKDSDNIILYRLILVNIFSAFEYFLSQVLICKYASDENAFQNYIDIYKEKKNKDNETFIFNEEEIRDDIRRTVFGSDRKKLNIIYKQTFNTTFPIYDEKMNEFIRLRHLCVHRLGFTKGGGKVHIDNEIVNGMISSISSLVEDVSNILEPIKKS